ncbi:MAG: UDP-N-acetylmuramoyl-L-alanyl-D-glutamate--2,6-diaminopimelate ligase [Propionibacteriaceae bacterium]|nr:UDP-N-acetylmuramoyl-L-alanyl-D-glutamate--2,6-diaminopimelate ligase [Propionibacteriaceae bacterium]
MTPRPPTAPTPTPRVGKALSAIVDAWASRRAGADARVTGITLDSRLVEPGDLYVALPGAKVHGAAFVPQALAAGAVAVLTDPAGEADLPADLGVPLAVTDDVRGAMARVADELFDRPAHELTMFGVTGTNGKTTTTFLLAAVLRGVGLKVGTIGTLGFQLDGEDLPVARTTVTTPESVDLHALLARMRDHGADAVAMEVSSHAMVLRRTEPVHFDVVGFTNLSPEHLDFHHDMADYFEAKAALFVPERARAAVVFVDDPAGVRLAERIAGTGVTLRTLAWSAAADADYRITGVQAGRVHLDTPSGPREFELALPGDFNVTNAALALAMVELAGLDVARAAAALASVAVPGRMQPVPLEEGPAVYVDFAHTPEAVRSALAAFDRDRERGRRVVVVLGCGGDRDRHKRGPMGRVAAESADLVIVTDDNPRSEDPAAIRAAVLEGARSVPGAAGRVLDGGERRAAIAHALRAAAADDVVVVLGKGHEQGQEIAGTIHQFDDAGVVAQEWARAKERGWID